MGTLIFPRKGFLSLAFVFVFVHIIQADIYSAWYQTPSTDRDKIKTYIARDIIGDTVKEKWQRWKSKGFFTESRTPSGKKLVTFSTTAKKSLLEAFLILNYFPLLEEDTTFYRIPVDGQQIELKLTPDTANDQTFKASYLYTDQAGNKQETKLFNPKKITQELIAGTNDHQDLRKAIEEALPKILTQKIGNKGVFEQAVKKETSGGSGTFTNDDKKKAFRNALEVMASTTVMRRSPETWMTSVHDKIKENDFNLRFLMGEEVRRQWQEWKAKGLFTDRINPNTNIKEVQFKSPLNISPNEILHALQYFRQLETGVVRYFFNVDGVPFTFELAPDGQGFSAKSRYKDKNGHWNAEDISKYSTLKQAIDQNVKKAPNGEFEVVLNSKLRRIFKFPETINPKNVFKEAVKEETKRTKAKISAGVQDRVFRNAVEVMSAAILLNKPIPDTDLMSRAYQSIKPDLEIEENAMKNEITKNAIKEQWEEWRKKKIFTEKNNQKTNIKEVNFKSPLSISPNEIFHTLQYFRQLETGTVQYSLTIDGYPFKFELAPKGTQEFTAKRVYKDNHQIIRRKDISNFKSLRTEIDKDAFDEKYSGIENAITSSKFREIFRRSEKDDKKNLFEEAVKENTQPTQTVPPNVQEHVLKNTVDLMAASIMLKKPIPELYWMHSNYEWLHSELQKLDDKIKRKASESSIKNSWEIMKTNNMFTELNSQTKEVVFARNADITPKKIFDHIRHFPSLEKDKTVIYKFPIDGQNVKLKLERDGKGGFTAKYIYEDSQGNPQETDLSNTEGIIHNLIGTTHGQPELSSVLETTMPEMFKQKLTQRGTFDTALTSSSPNIQNSLKKNALRQTLEAIASMSLFGSDAKSWIDNMDGRMQSKRERYDDILNNEVQKKKQVKLKHELAASMAENINEVKAKWQQLQDLGYIEVDKASGLVHSFTISKDIPYNFKDICSLLQRFHDLYPYQGRNEVKVTMPIGGEDRVFYMGIGLYGENQLVVKTKQIDWQGTTKQSKVLSPYSHMIENLKLIDSKKLAQTMLDTINNKMNDQPVFSTELDLGFNSQQESKNLIRSTTEFLLATMIAEASNPPSNVRDKYNSDLVNTINRKRKFPDQGEMPHLEKLKNQAGENLKEGRSPTANLVAIKLLQEIAATGKRFDKVFSDAPDKYPFMKKDGGTAEGRKFLFVYGDDQIPSIIILEEAAGEHDGQTLAKRARLSCTGSGNRKKREACSLEEVSDNMMVDDESIKVDDNNVQLELVDRHDATKRKRLTIPITSDELATPQLIKQTISNSERPAGNPRYAKINKGLAVHGLIFSAIGAIDYFQRGDNVHGGIAVSQSLHTLGGLTGFNEIASKATKQVLRHAAFKVARGLNMEKGLERFSLKVEKFMEKGVGKLMGALPGVGLAFDIYFIEQDIEALSKLDLNNPEDLKMLPLRVVDLVLDVDTTVLNLIGTFCPEAEVITEPLIIVLSIVRMAIDDFYVDIMEEMDKVNWNSPWAGFEFIGALFKGILYGAADFLSGGLRRQMENYSKQEKADKELLSSLKDATSYYKITGKKGEKTIDFTQGKLSSFGGFITFRMCDNGMAHLEIGDVTGNHETETKSFKIDHDVKDIVLGIGESREFLYETKTAKLWAFIPVKHYKVIKNANLKSSSLFGTYYGDSKNNKFFAVQNQKKNKKQKDYHQCDYGKIDIGFVTGRYHYNLYGRGGDDSFYLGPQMSKVTGGLGNDVYIVQSYGGNTIIDNFAEDNKRDMVIINVPYDDISCSRKNIDLDILYKNTHHIRITNWFVPGNTKYYRHISFKSQDGVIFIAKDIGSGAKCIAIAIAKGTETKPQTISTNNEKFSEVKQVVGTDYNDRIYGNKLNNILDGGKGRDFLKGGLSADTYIIRAGEGCDVIDNFAEDYKKSTDVVIFNVDYKNIILEVNGHHLKVLDRDNAQSCVEIYKWLKGDKYQHMLFTSLDHVVFKVKKLNNQYTKFPMMLDYSSSKEGVRIDLHHPPLKGYTHHKGFDQVSTVTDSKYTDHIKGNKQSNFLSCTGGRDVLYGGPGSDNYIVKKSCEVATIINLDRHAKVDLLLIDYKFQELTLSKHQYNLIINYDAVHPKVILSQWYTHDSFRHIWVRSKDGMTLRINGDKKTLEPVEISKDPEECLCRKKGCPPQHIKYDLSKEPWTTVTRFQLKSSLCSYNIRGNDLNNYIDPGSGNGYSYQHLRGGNGADTYVLKHGYGEFNVINNIADDKKNDTLKLGLEINDIKISFYDENDVILASKARPKSLSVRIKNYFKGPEFQHLQVITTDEVTFEINKVYPFMKFISMDLSRFETPGQITLDEELLSSEAQSVKGTLNYPNKILGTVLTKQIEGGFQNDVLFGGPGDNIIKGKQGNDELFGRQGNDIIFGGDGDDLIGGGDGNDYIYGGDGKDTIDGGPGGDTMCFKGDGFDKIGVYVDLSGGFGKRADAEGDKYTSVEHVYGTIHDDTLIGSDSDNNLHGLNGNDILIAKGGDDQLVGGNGKDRYILDNGYGIKTIDNYAEDKVKDTLSLSNTYSDDVCVFLVDDDLHLQVKQKSLTSLLFQKKPLSVIVTNWNKSYKYRHLNILFKDAFWPSRSLGKSKHHIIQKTDVIKHMEKKSNFAFSSGKSFGLSWNPYQRLPFDDQTQIEILQYDLENPQNSKRTELSKDAISNGKFAINNFQRSKHYIFALLLKFCSAIIGRSYSLTYLGEKRPCSAINVPHSVITYNPQGSKVHGSKATVTCSSGYKFKSSATTTYTGDCLDGKWQPDLPTCIAKASCPQVTKPDNGEVRSESITEGAMSTYICDKGFQLVGLKERRCNEDGKWAGEEPKCERTNCFQLPKVKHGKLTECNGKSTIYGTMESPKDGFCVKLTCDTNYVENWKLNYMQREFATMLPGKAQSTWTCIGNAWKGVGTLSCHTAVRLTQTQTTWHEVNGILQEWDDAKAEWKNSLSRDTTKHQLACANAIGVESYKEKTRILSDESQSLKIACPKIRFGEMVTKFEGKLETFTEGNWQPTCLIGPDTNRRLATVYEHMCTEIGLEYNKPGIAMRNHGPTSYIVACSRESSDINACDVQKYSIADCTSLLQCKRRCDNVFPVANAVGAPCKHHYEGASCDVQCKFGFKLVGPKTVYCKSGVWTYHKHPAVSRCDEDKLTMLLQVFERIATFGFSTLGKVIEENKKNQNRQSG